MRTLCAIFAHPDDETFSVGGTLAHYAAEGVEITLITATSGDAGEVGSAPVEKEELGPWREKELRAAADALGVRHLHLLRLPDGQLADHEEELFAAIRGKLHAIRPQVVVTEDARGITGHPDHLAVTRTLLRAVEELGDDGPLKLYESVVPLSRAPAHIQGTPDDYISTIVNVESSRERIMAAFRAHRSQVPEETIERFRSFPAPWQQYFICIRTRVPILIPESDLFAGIAP